MLVEEDTPVAEGSMLAASVAGENMLAVVVAEENTPAAEDWSGRTERGLCTCFAIEDRSGCSKTDEH